MTRCAGSNYGCAEMSERFVVHGGKRLSGSVRPAGNKNAALPMIAASLMADGVSVINNVPRITDVLDLLELVQDLGGEVDWSAPNTLRIDAGSVESKPLNPALCARIRASILMAGPLLARFGSVRLPPPGGDVIGRRRIDTHFLALSQLGASVNVGGDYHLEADRLTGSDIFLDEPSVTGTENALMAAVKAEGETLLQNAACEPHVQDLARALVAMGADIEGIGTNTLRVRGVPELRAAELEVGPDHIEIGSFIGLAVVTKSELSVEGVRPADLRSIRHNFRRLGIETSVEQDTLVIPGPQECRISPDLGGHIPKIEDGPWPAFPADLTSIAVVVATQCHGVVMVFEKMFESRLFFVDKLTSLGARVVLCDPHRVLVYGPSALTGGVVESPDIRAGMAMLIAALAADGTSEIHNVRQIDRGYEQIDRRLRQLGADIERAGSAEA